ncbi:short-chain dehydrogenase/reductase [Mycolicibacterium sp. 018/SC-01/001]|uniref:short-chain dehydrogenase/reductase n=1 Tax=Mycolicibacterium sp. 018/SC-01/001 TaxID=2592069 RepID=UPI0021069A51|nr:short-chain dehydrogenase/reductase [Mycolicibacterium sp. 018/SC-01/001]
MILDDALRLAGRTVARAVTRPPRYDLEGRVVFITGAARGLGAATARRAHVRGARVALVGRRLAPLQELAAELGSGAAAFEADVTSAEQLQQAATDAVATFGGIDVVIANAGIAPPSHTVATIDTDAFERTVDVDLLGQWRTVRATLPAVLESRGHILLVGSIYAFFNGVLAAPYAVSKAGVEQLARTLRVELASHGATAGIAYLGFIDTDLAADAFADASAQAIRQAVPRVFTREMTVTAAADAMLDAIERRAPQVSAPAWVRPLLAFRSVTTAVMDDVLLHNRNVQTAISDAEVAARQPES